MVRVAGHGVGVPPELRVDTEPSEQIRHGLHADGVIGPMTFEAMTIPLAWRARRSSLALNASAAFPCRGVRVVLVNVPMFHLWAIGEVM